MSNFSRLIIHRFLNIRRVHLLLLLLLAATPYTTEQSSSDSSQYPYGFDDKITPSMTIIIVVLVCAFFFMGFFTIYIRQCTENSAMVTSGPSTANGLSLQSPHGLDPAVIESFPIFVYWEIKDIKIGEGALECAVCLSEFEGDENLRLLPKCDHVFHPECIDTWFASHTTCPVCRADLTLISGESAGVIEQRVESNDLADEQIPGSEVGELQDQVSINVENALCSDSKLVEIMNQSRRIAEKFPRSHSTGHSLVQPGENCERYKLTLPDEVRKQMMTQRLKRTTSCIVVLRREGSSKRGYTSGGEGSSRGKRMGESDRVGSSDRWVFKMTPPFFTRTGSVRSLKVCADKSVLVVGSSKVVSRLPFREG